MQLREYVYEPSLHQPAHTHDTMSLSFVARGGVEENAAGTRRTGGAGDVIVKPAGVVHEDTFGPRGAKMFTLVLDEDIGPYRWLFGGAPAALFTRAVLDWRAGAEFADVAIDLVASLDRTNRTTTPRMHESAERVATTAVTVEALARELSMHPVALARAFRREHGMSITCFRRRARVRRAAALLSASAMPLADVALESGFTDQSHFCRIFKTEMGLTPAAFRMLTV
jgi:AraC-like DNA-binding protein